MLSPKSNYFWPLVISITVHLFFALLLIGYNADLQKIDKPKVQVIQAVMIDKAAMEKMQNRQSKPAQNRTERLKKEQEKKDKLRKEKARKAQLKKEQAKKAADKKAALKRIEQEKIAEKKRTEKKRVAEQNRLAEQKRLAEVKRQADAQIKADKALAAKKKAEEERKLKLKLEQERLQKEKAAKEKAAKEKAAKEKAENERIEKAAIERAQREAEMSAMADLMSQEAQGRDKQRRAQVLSEVDKYKALIMNKIQRSWIVDDSMRNKQCVLAINLATSGFVIKVSQGEGDRFVCRSARTAILKLQTLPVSDDPDVFAKLKNINLILKPEF